MKNVLKLLFIYKKGGSMKGGESIIKNRKDLNIIAKNLDINYKKYKTKKQLVKKIKNATKYIQSMY